MNQPFRLARLLATAVLLAGCTTPAQQPPTAPEPSTFPSPSGQESPRGTVQVIAAGLQAPWSITFAGDTTLLSERDSGRILELDAAGQTRQVGQLDDVVHGGEGGLLGLAFHAPDQLYAYSTGPAGNRIQRFTLEGRAGNYTLGTVDTLLDGLPSGSIHNGGRLAFGPDGMLYAAVGDAGNRALAQDLASLGGKILRLSPDGQIPGDNPFPGSPVFSYGHRNVQGLAWDAGGVMYASEFGQNTWDELNIITGGANYGWPVTEGIAEAGNQYTNPLAQWPTSQASPSGIAIRESVLYLANLRGQRVRAVNLVDPEQQIEVWVGDYGRLRDIVLTGQDELWVVSNNTDGRGSPGPEDDRILLLEPVTFNGP